MDFDHFEANQNKLNTEIQECGKKLLKLEYESLFFKQSIKKLEIKMQSNTLIKIEEINKYVKDKLDEYSEIQTSLVEADYMDLQKKIMELEIFYYNTFLNAVIEKRTQGTYVRYIKTKFDEMIFEIEGLLLKYDLKTNE
jgi:hypothetical protein